MANLLNFDTQFAYSVIDTANSSKRDNRYIRASSLGGCGRRAGYMLLGYQPLPHDGKTVSAFNVGTAVHNMIQAKLVEIGLIDALPYWNSERWQMEWIQGSDPQSGCELEAVDHTLRILGHCDGVTVPLIKDDNGFLVRATDKLAGERYLIEIKTISDRGRYWILGFWDGGKNPIDETATPAEFIEIPYVKSKSSGKRQQRLFQFSHTRQVNSDKYGPRVCPVYKVKDKDGNKNFVTVVMTGHNLGGFSELEEPKREHVIQATYYANHFKVGKILFLYIGKDVDEAGYSEQGELSNYPIKSYIHNVDPIDVDFIKAKTEMIYESVDKGNLPDRDYDPTDRKAMCRFCEFRTQCAPEAFGSQLIPANELLVKLGKPELTEGPGVMHKYKADLTNDFALSRIE